MEIDKEALQGEIRGFMNTWNILVEQEKEWLDASKVDLVVCWRSV